MTASPLLAVYGQNIRDGYIRHASLEETGEEDRLVIYTASCIACQGGLNVATLDNVKPFVHILAHVSEPNK
ncbi:hypothetical protein OUZ56_015923 [Daphnia magna]|uniref:Uncharacterized protein n=1 Tax=Daphnia magna TaxID=35525 RepID=A0ABR0AP55_9CRUS|nr:hypothetical protein OUZ56_015923 [Daphnia magna]